MQLSLTQQNAADTEAGCILVGIFDDSNLDGAAREIDERSGGALTRLRDSGDIKGKLAHCELLRGLPGIKASRVLVLGLGERAKFDGARFAKVAGTAHKAVRGTPATHAVDFLCTLPVAGRDSAFALRQSALIAQSQGYRYTATLRPKAADAPKLEQLAFNASADHAPILEQALAIGDGVRLARELGNLPPNICTPAYMAEQARVLAERIPGVSIEVLEREQMATLGMGSLLGVAQGSANEPKLIVLQYRGAADDRAPYALVGKGITFDTGGICIKPGAGMEEMKFDMCGAAGVLGAFAAVAQMKLPINLVCVVPAVENMPSGTAYRPGDVLTSMSGQTIEVINTDAEGRLILCDALTYVQRFKPQAIVDVATLTGACVIALGKHASGLMSRDDSLASELLAAGDKAMDRAWRLPLWDEYQPQIDSVFADMANVGGKSAGAITAGCFLARFTENQRWAHLDVAGTAWDEGRKGTATGRPVGLLAQWLIDCSKA